MKQPIQTPFTTYTPKIDARTHPHDRALNGMVFAETASHFESMTTAAAAKALIQSVESAAEYLRAAQKKRIRRGLKWGPSRYAVGNYFARCYPQLGKDYESIAAAALAGRAAERERRRMRQHPHFAK